MFYVLCLLINGLIFGYVCRMIIHNKGYSEDWFPWGFLFGIFACLVALSKQPVQVNYEEVQRKQQQDEREANLAIFMKYQKLHEQGVLTDAEFERKKKELL